MGGSMNRRLRRVATVAVSVLAATLGAAALAWACVPGSTNFQVNPNRGPAGTTVSVSDNTFPQENGEAEIRWEDGRVLGRASVSERRLYTQVRIPADAAPGTYTISAVPAGCGGHACHAGGVAAFQVSGASDARPGPVASGPSARNRAISRCKRRYRGSTRSAKRKRAACIRKAKRRYRA